MDVVLVELRKIPSVTRLLTLSLVGVTFSSILNFVSAYKLIYVQSYVFSNFEFWRLYTSFFLGTHDIVFIFEVYLLYRSADQLERGPYGLKAGDLAWQLFFSAIAIIACSYPIRTKVFLHPFTLCMVYLSSAIAPRATQLSLFGLFTFPVKYYPYVLLGLSLLTGGPRSAARDVCGLIVGHLWWWGVWKSRAWEEIGRAPKWLATWLGDRPGSLVDGGWGGTATGVRVFAPRAKVQPGDNGSFRGNGHRLGGS